MAKVYEVADSGQAKVKEHAGAKVTVMGMVDGMKITSVESVKPRKLGQLSTLCRAVFGRLGKTSQQASGSALSARGRAVPLFREWPLQAPLRGWTAIADWKAQGPFDREACIGYRTALERFRKESRE